MPTRTTSLAVLSIKIPILIDVGTTIHWAVSVDACCGTSGTSFDGLVDFAAASVADGFNYAHIIVREDVFLCVGGA